MKTQCPHCKAKINAPSEYKGKKVKCPKCKESFVCVESAETTIPAKLSNRPKEVAEKCENCGRTIGKLEQTYVYEGDVVCQQCNGILQRPIKESSQQPVYVTPTKSTSGFGIAALVLGIIACLTCWRVNFSRVPVITIVFPASLSERCFFDCLGLTPAANNCTP